MLYLIYGTKEYLIKQEVKKIKKDFDSNSISNYDLLNDQINVVIEDASTFSLFSQDKLIIVNNAIMFTPNKEKVNQELEKYLKNPNPNTTIIFIVNQEKIDNRKKITKAIKENGKIIEYNENINTIKYIKDSLKDYQITSKEVNLIKERVGENIGILHNEIEKLKIYKNKDKTITQEDIINLTHKTVDTNIFKLIDYIVQNDKNKAIEIYHQMLKINEEPVKIIITLANQFRIIYQSKELLKKGYTEKDIAETIKVHPYRVKLALQNGRKYDSKMLLNYLYELEEIDYNIKTGQIDKNLALELFILKK